MCLRITSASMPEGVKRTQELVRECVRVSARSLGLTSRVCCAVEQPEFSAQKAKILFHEGASPLQAMRPNNRTMGPTGEVLPASGCCIPHLRQMLHLRKHPESQRASWASCMRCAEPTAQCIAIWKLLSLATE